jgi:hypothetical protein
MSEFTASGYDNTPDIYLANQEVGSVSELSDKALANQIFKFTSVLRQHGLMPRAFEGTERIMAHLTFEQRYREGFYDDAIAAHRAQEAPDVIEVAPDGEPALVSRELQ